METIERVRIKVVSDLQMMQRVATWRLLSKKIVFTNGCFDLLHLGHVDYLSKAADAGDVLIVAVNTDNSVRKLKGEHRPINNEEQRTMLLASLSFVDAVVLFDQPTPYEMIQMVQPDVLVKGADYKPEEIVGYDIVIGRGGLVKTIDILQGYSTSLIEQRIIQHQEAGIKSQD